MTADNHDASWWLALDQPSADEPTWRGQPPGVVLWLRACAAAKVAERKKNRLRRNYWRDDDDATWDATCAAIDEHSRLVWRARELHALIPIEHRPGLAPLPARLVEAMDRLGARPAVWLHDAYIVRGRTIAAIAQELAIPTSAVHDGLRKLQLDDPAAARAARREGMARSLATYDGTGVDEPAWPK